MMKMKKRPPMKASPNGEPINPFLQDMYHMGTPIGTNVI